jgi:hypothetical protein
LNGCPSLFPFAKCIAGVIIGAEQRGEVTACSLVRALCIGASGMLLDWSDGIDPRVTKLPDHKYCEQREK